MIYIEPKQKKGGIGSMKGQRGQIYLIFLVLLAIGLVVFVLTQIRLKGGGEIAGTLPAALENFKATAETEEKTSLKEKEGITIEGDLDIVHLADGGFYTIEYNSIDKRYTVVIDDPSREAEARQKAADWFASKGVSDINKVPIDWFIKHRLSP